MKYCKLIYFRGGLIFRWSILIFLLHEQLIENGFIYYALVFVLNVFASVETFVANLNSRKLAQYSFPRKLMSAKLNNFTVFVCCW